jgi:oligopeptide transport system ATP-binding protein
MITGSEAVVEAVRVRKVYAGRWRQRSIVAVDDVSLRVGQGQSIGVVGESGSGKTTLARCLARLIEPTDGRIRVLGQDVTDLTGRALRRLRREIQMVFQDPYDALDPRWRVDRSIEEPLRRLTRLTAPERERRVEELLGLVRLGRGLATRYPHQLSGGQQQRVGIARALATSPKVLVLDEPTSALDALVRVQILDLLNRLRRELDLTYVYISHDIGSVERVCDRIAVMYLGRVVEEGATSEVIARPEHPYTRALMSAVLEPDLRTRTTRRRLRGDIAGSGAIPPGCALHTRCPVAVDDCAEIDQRLVELRPGHRVACSRLSRGDEIRWPPGWGSDPMATLGPERAS